MMSFSRNFAASSTTSASFTINNSFNRLFRGRCVSSTLSTRSTCLSSTHRKDGLEAVGVGQQRTVYVDHHKNCNSSNNNCVDDDKSDDGAVVAGAADDATTTKPQTSTRSRRSRIQNNDNTTTTASTTNKKRRLLVEQENIPSYKEFVHRFTMLTLYRNFFKALRYVPAEHTRLELKQQIRQEFRALKHVDREEDPFQIQRAVAEGKRRLQELQDFTGQSNVNNTEASLSSWIHTVDPEDPRGRVGSVWPWQK